MMTSLRCASLAVAVGLMLAAAAASPAATSGSAPKTAAAQAPVVKTEPPFARVYLAVRGCMSCAHCRTNIRQMVRANSQGGETQFGDDQIEVIYPTPRPVPLREVIRSLAENRLHDLSLVDVLFDARGVIHTSEKGVATFALAKTGQSFSIVVDPGSARPPDGTSVRLTARVDGWREKGTLSLHAREVRPAN